MSNEGKRSGRPTKAAGGAPAKPMRPGRSLPAGSPPEFPDGLEVDLPGGVRRELKRLSRSPEETRNLGLALTAATRAIDELDPETAITYLSWARQACPRSPAIREALGAAHYLAEDYSSALSELQAYRRISGRADQNHLVADSLRGVGRETEKIPALIEEMADSAPADRYLEGLIVWAAQLADEGDPEAGLAVLRRGVGRLDDLDDDVTETHLRVWYVAGDLAARSGSPGEARTWFEQIEAVAEGYLDTEKRLAEL